MERSQEPISDSDRYSAAIQLLVVSENTSWNRFNSFLVFETLLALAWAAIYTASITKGMSEVVVLASVSLLGIIGGIVCGRLGRRGRAFVRKFQDLGIVLEQRETHAVNPCRESADLSDKHPDKWFGSYTILRKAPLVVSALFAVFLIVSLLRIWWP